MNVAEKLQALLTASNATTGEADTTLTDAVQRLVDGYGGGGGFIKGEFTSAALGQQQINHNANADSYLYMIVEEIPGASEDSGSANWYNLCQIGAYTGGRTVSINGKSINIDAIAIAIRYRGNSFNLSTVNLDTKASERNCFYAPATPTLKPGVKFNYYVAPIDL